MKLKGIFQCACEGKGCKSCDNKGYIDLSKKKFKRVGKVEYKSTEKGNLVRVKGKKTKTIPEYLFDKEFLRSKP